MTNQRMACDGLEFPTDDRETALEEICNTVCKLLSKVPHPPTTLNIRAGIVSVELKWSPSGESPHMQPLVIKTSSEAGGSAAVDLENIHTEIANLVISAPTVGIFYRSPAPGTDPFVVAGDTVVTGQQVGIIEAMKLMIPVEAGHPGTINAVLVDDGISVEFGQALFRLTGS
jgi:acetyl-CoA carboxylase biotin carboxyl carrier protein